jgi:hypothetical protein
MSLTSCEGLDFDEPDEFCCYGPDSCATRIVAGYLTETCEVQSKVIPGKRLRRWMSGKLEHVVLYCNVQLFTDYGSGFQLTTPALEYRRDLCLWGDCWSPQDPFRYRINENPDHIVAWAIDTIYPVIHYVSPAEWAEEMAWMDEPISPKKLQKCWDRSKRTLDAMCGFLGEDRMMSAVFEAYDGGWTPELIAWAS